MIRDANADLGCADAADGADLQAGRHASRPPPQRALLDSALKQNITTLHNRINELGVAEPVIQQQGADRIVVQLPGVQDTARAKDILGRTATLEARLVDLTPRRRPRSPASGAGAVRLRAVHDRPRRAGGAEKQAIFTGEQLTGAQATFDENQRPAVAIDLNDAAGRVLRDVSRENIKKPMAVVLFEKGRGEVLTVATIQSELGSRFQITGMESAAGVQRPGAAAARRRAGRADGDHRGAHDRPQPGRREHRQGLQRDAVRLRRDRACS